MLPTNSGCGSPAVAAHKERSIQHSFVSWKVLDAVQLMWAVTENKFALVFYHRTEAYENVTHLLHF